jgi:hypothetical protein
LPSFFQKAKKTKTPKIYTIHHGCVVKEVFVHFFQKVGGEKIKNEKVTNN